MSLDHSPLQIKMVHKATKNSHKENMSLDISLFQLQL